MLKLNRWICILLLMIQHQVALGKSPIGEGKVCYMDNGEQGTCYEFEYQGQHKVKAMVLEKTGGLKDQPPIVLLAGGPGQGAIKAFEAYIPMLGKLRKDRDILLVDQPGTGSSSPIKCPALDGMTAVQQMQNQERTVEILLNCANTQLKKDPEIYGTDSYVKLIEMIRKELAYDKLALFGVSYGTRVAVRYGQLFSSSISKIILEGVAGNELRLFENAAIGDKVTLEYMERRLADSKQLESFAQVKKQIVSRLPVTMAIEDPNTGKKELVRVDETILNNSIRIHFYDPGLVSILPVSMARALDGDYQALLTPALTFDGGLNIMHLYTVACSEDYYEGLNLEGFPEKDIEQLKKDLRCLAEI